MYILNEKKYLLEILKQNKIPRDLSKTYLFTLLAKHYYSSTVTVDELVNYVKNRMIDFDLDVLEYQEYKWIKKIEEICKKVITEDNKFREIDYIPIYKSEIDKITSLDSDRKKKLLFTLYVIARYMNTDGWINKKDSKSIAEVFKLANVTVSIQDRFKLIHDLYDEGFISMSKKIDNLNLQVYLSDETDEIAYRCSEFSNIGNQYIGNFKDGYMQCVSCGKSMKRKNNKMKYCNSCAKSNKNELNKKYYHEK